MLITVEYDAVIASMGQNIGIHKWEHFTQTFKSMKTLADWLLRASHLMIRNINITQMAHFNPPPAAENLHK
jgi:hypothetical protein